MSSQSGVIRVLWSVLSADSSGPRYSNRQKAPNGVPRTTGGHSRVWLAHVVAVVDKALGKRRSYGYRGGAREVGEVLSSGPGR